MMHNENQRLTHNYYTVNTTKLISPSQPILGTLGRVFSLLPTIYRYSVLLPTALLAIYYGLISSDKYLVQAHVVVEQDSLSSTPSLELGLLSLGGSGDQNDALIVEAFMESNAMLEQVNSALNIREHYSSNTIDWFSRLNPTASKEDLFEYFLKNVSASVNSESSIIQLDVAAYSPAFAKNLADSMVALSEVFVNEVSQGLAQQQLDFVKSEVDKNSRRLAQATADLILLQQQYEIVSPEVEAQTLGEIIAGLQAELAKERAILKTKLSYLTNNAPEVVSSRKRVAALQQQIEQEREAQTGGGESAINHLHLKYQSAQLAVTVASEVYQASIASLESARLEASRKVKYLVAISGAQLPEEAQEPRRAYAIATGFLLLNLLYLIIVLVIATINDHRE